MKTCLIPPIAHLEMAKGRKYHLCLAHLLENERYHTFYLSESSAGSYVILDNSAHEQQVGESIAALLGYAYEIQASEIVLPDHLFEMEDTIKRTSEAILYLSNHATNILDSFITPPNFMIVPQGRDLTEYETCLTTLGDAFRKAMPTGVGLTIGVSKDFEVWAGGLFSLLDRTVIPASRKYHAQIHLLGWGRDLWALKRINQTFGSQIRSVDSAKPFVFALYGIALDPPATPIYPKRPENYFTSEPMDKEQYSAARWNIDVFDSMVNGKVKE